MTKTEALEIEKKCDELMSNALSWDCNVSQALTGRLKVAFDSNFINVSSDFSEVQYVGFHGYYEELITYCRKILQCLNENRELFEKLMWSYSHIMELTNE